MYVWAKDTVEKTDKTSGRAIGNVKISNVEMGCASPGSTLIYVFLLSAKPIFRFLSLQSTARSRESSLSNRVI